MSEANEQTEVVRQRIGGLELLETETPGMICPGGRWCFPLGSRSFPTAHPPRDLHAGLNFRPTPPTLIWRLPAPVELTRTPIISNCPRAVKCGAMFLRGKHVRVRPGPVYYRQSIDGDPPITIIRFPTGKCARRAV